MICKCCGQTHDKISDFLIIDGEVYCREIVVETHGTVGNFIRELIDPLYEGE
jgi:hypothetical protein